MLEVTMLIAALTKIKHVIAKGGACCQSKPSISADSGWHLAIPRAVIAISNLKYSIPLSVNMLKTSLPTKFDKSIFIV